MPAKTNQPELFSSKDDYNDQSYAVTAKWKEIKHVGKKVKGTKRRVTWVFGYCNRTHTVELYDSLTSGKKRLVVDGKTVFQSVLSDLEFSHVVAINEVNVRVTKKHIIIGPDQYVMTIDGTKFSQLRRSSLEVKGSPPPPGAGERVSNSTELAKELQGESSEEEEEEEKDEECEKNESNPFGWSESFEETKQSISSTQSSNNEKDLLGLAVCDNQTAPPAPGSGTIPSPKDAFKSLQELAHSLGQQRNYNAGMQQQQQFNQYQMPTSPHAQQMNFNQFQMPTAQQQNFQQQAGSFQQQAGFPSTGDEFAHLHLQSQQNGTHGQFGMASPTHQQHQPINSIHGIGSPHSQHGRMLQQQGGMMSPTHNNNVQQQQMQNSNNMIAPIGMVQQHANNTWQSNQPVSSMNVQQQQSQQQQLQQLQQQHQQPQQQVQQQQPQQQLQPQQQSTVKNPFESFDNGSKTITNNNDAQNGYSLGSMTNAKNNKYIPTANADNFNPFDF